MRSFGPLANCPQLSPMRDYDGDYVLILYTIFILADKNKMASLLHLLDCLRTNH